MKIQQNWDNSRLAVYLLYDNWKPISGCLVLAGFDYYLNGALKEKVLPSELTWKQALNPLDFYPKPEKVIPRTTIKGMYENFLMLIELWSNANYQNDLPRPPSFFIEWALSKKFKPDWFWWAIEKNLLPIDGVSEDQSNNTSYQPAWLKIQNEAITEFFNPRRNPDAKRDEVVEWIKQAALKAGLPNSENVAAAMFTIIKPENHDPKKKRVEPKD